MWSCGFKYRWRTENQGRRGEDSRIGSRRLRNNLKQRLQVSCSSGRTAFHKGRQKSQDDCDYMTVRQMLTQRWHIHNPRFSSVDIEAIENANLIEEIAS